MSRVAVFVDAGYLFAQGSTALTGSKKGRSQLELNETAAISELIAIAKSKSEQASILRVYWYDAPLGPRSLSLEHTKLAHTDHVKLRLGLLNNQGEQKGVDSLIVTDLIELARNNAISDALLLSGDEDVRIGVVIAQSFGVRVHLLGIVPCRGSQSLLLMQESDTTTEWDRAVVTKFLAVKAATTAAPISSAVTAPSSATSTDASAALDAACNEVLGAIDPHTAQSMHEFWKTKSGLPREIDGRLLAKGRSRAGHDLDAEEKRYVRNKFLDLFRIAYPSA